MGIMRFLTTNVDKMWYQELENAETFYTKVTALKLTEHLRKCSGGRHAIDTVNIMYDTHQYFDEAASIPVYINMIETAPKTAACAKLSISDDMLVAISTRVILVSDCLPRATDAWEEKADADKTCS